MISGMIADNDLFSLSYVDINRQPPHYAYETMLAYRNINPYGMYVFVMGSDSLRDLPTWYEVNKFLTLCNQIGVMHRPGDEADLLKLETRIPGITDKTIFFNSPLVDISSTLIRERVRNHLPVQYLLHSFVYQLIQTRGLYTRLSEDE